MLRLKVKDIARERGLSMGKLSRLADVDYTTIKRMFDDANYSPTIETLWKIKRVLQVSLDELVEEVPN
ncbi:MAG TPA: XRE family transcriptional regulator [Ktedonobacter sp.]|jgi:transcriptional regulator with XRE-family HTH domain|nr:XRE family transcriptional regulator [Ktedonobacter sp.]HAG99381.1 XRE family transcriptional regulator [Ktedonobacter sp.]HCF85634.1 XRE family transcriptional regulator [Ktedonobacter sp.]HCJ33642.1 XRE family transcriptional regulator [Ktedonobacter sp.]